MAHERGKMIILNRAEKAQLHRIQKAGHIDEMGDRVLNRLANRQLVKWERRPGGWIGARWTLTAAGEQAIGG